MGLKNTRFKKKKKGKTRKIPPNKATRKKLTKTSGISVNMKFGLKNDKGAKLSSKEE